jgi:hypothetical protein
MSMSRKTRKQLLGKRWVFEQEKQADALKWLGAELRFVWRYPPAKSTLDTQAKAHGHLHSAA